MTSDKSIIRRYRIEMDLEIAALFYAKATVHAFAGTLREVTNAVIENQYLRLIFTLLPLSAGPTIRPGKATLETSNARGFEPIPFTYLFISVRARAPASKCSYVHVET